MSDPIRCYDFENGFDAHVGGPCCFQSIPGVDNFKKMHQHPVYLEIQQSFNNGQWPDKYCTICRDIENLNSFESKSKRQSSLHKLNVDGELQCLTIDTGRLCNIQCRSCHPSLSSSWIKEYQQLPDDIKESWFNTSIKVYPHNNYNYIEENLSKVKFVQFLGGEPIYNIQSLDILEKLYRETNGECTISFTTNATIQLDFEKNTWLKKFKQINLVLSLDAIGAPAEYIRTGCNWTTIEKNINFYKSIPNVSLSYHPTFSVLNLFESRRLLDWGHEQNIWRVSETTWVENLKYLSYSILTSSEKRYVSEYLRNNDLDFLASKVDQSNFSPEDREDFFKFMEHTTRYHAMDWKDYLPELYNLLNTQQ